MDDEGWEARMAARAAQRAAARKVDADRVAEVEWGTLRRREEREAAAYHAATMTLDDGTEMLQYGGYPCACSGGIGCCAYRFQAAQRLRRAAWVAATLFADLAKHRREGAST